MNLLVGFYREYVAAKESKEWGPTVVKQQGEMVSKKIQSFYSDGLKAGMELARYADAVSKRATESLQKIYMESDFQKIVQFLNEENEVEQERMLISAQLTQISSKIRVVEGKIRYITQQQIRKQAEEVLKWYRQQMQTVIEALRALVQLHKDSLKGLIG